MSTACSIGYVHPVTKKIHWVMLQCDGYPSSVLPMLLQNYNTLDRVSKLIEHGHISRLYASMECPEGHNFDHPVKGHCVFYRRDRGDTDVDTIISPKTKRNEMCYNDYAYLYGIDMEWYGWDYVSRRWTLVNRYKDPYGLWQDVKQSIKKN